MFRASQATNIKKKANATIDNLRVNRWENLVQMEGYLSQSKQKYITGYMLKRSYGGTSTTLDR